MNLSIKSLAPKDFGVYVCASVNALGKTENQVSLHSKWEPHTAKKSNVIIFHWLINRLCLVITSYFLYPLRRFRYAVVAFYYAWCPTFFFILVYLSVNILYDYIKFEYIFFDDSFLPITRTPLFYTNTRQPNLHRQLRKSSNAATTPVGEKNRMNPTSHYALCFFFVKCFLRSQRSLWD